jgi:lambda family phage portal protein
MAAHLAQSGFGAVLDRAILSIDPARALRRKAARFAYDALANDRTLSRTIRRGGPADSELDEHTLDRLREIARDLSQNNPLVKGILLTEADDVVGTETQVQARSPDTAWNRDCEQLFKEEMLDRPCDLTGRFSFQKILYTAFLSYRRDGDFFLLFTDDGLQLCEGDQCGTPGGQSAAETFDVVNGVAVSKTTGRVIGYYLGKPNKWGYIAADSWRQYEAQYVHHVFNPDRTSYTRGEPVLTSSVTTIKKLWGYIDAELVAAKVNACLSMFIEVTDDSRVPLPYKQGRFKSGEDEEGTKVQKLSPGEVWYGNAGEKPHPIMPTRPAAAFDPYLLRMLMIIGRPLCLPLLLVALDFSQATYMNMRGAFQQAQKAFKREQVHVVMPLVSRIWTEWLTRAIRRKQLKAIDGAYRHEVLCQRWPYVDPVKEAQADQMELENRTTTRGRIVARKGWDYQTLLEQQARERKMEQAAGVAEPAQDDSNPAEDDSQQEDPS